PYDIAIGHPNDGQHTITAKGITHLVSKGQDFEHQTGPLFLSIKTALEGDVIRMDHRVRTSSDRVLKNDVETYKSDYDAFRRALSFTVDLSGITAPEEAQMLPSPSAVQPQKKAVPLDWIYNGVTFIVAILIGGLIGTLTMRRRRKATSTL
ncbi:MAG: hypothetical protein AAF723_08775, partial [Pseudomonadota bacterium]